MVKESTVFMVGHQARRMGSSCSKDPNSPVAFREGRGREGRKDSKREYAFYLRIDFIEMVTKPSYKRQALAQRTKLIDYEGIRMVSKRKYLTKIFHDIREFSSHIVLMKNSR